jgi:hypothetical protein
MKTVASNFKLLKRNHWREAADGVAEDGLDTDMYSIYGKFFAFRRTEVALIIAGNV